MIRRRKLSFRPSIFRFPTGKKTILQDVSFSVRKGEYVAVVGPNGAGKSTLLKCFDRLLEGGKGSLIILGKDRKEYGQRELARQVAYVPQADSRYIPFTVEQFLLICRYPYLSPFATIRREDREAIQKALEGTRTAEFASRALSTLSGGERQKVFIAAALAQESPIWLLDEPTTFLDYHRQEEILSLLARLNEDLGLTIVAVTHDLNHAVLETDRVIALKEGKIAFNGTPDAVMQPEVLHGIYDTTPLLVDHPEASIPMILPRITKIE